MALILQPPVSATPKLISNPGAGNEFTFTVDDNFIYNIVAIFYTFTGVGGVGQRNTLLSLTDGVNTIARFGTTNTIGAGEAFQVCWQNSGVVLENNTSTIQINPIPANIFIYPGYNLATITTGGEAGDTFTAIILWVYQHLTPLTA